MLRRQKYALSQSTTPLACTLVTADHVRQSFEKMPSWPILLK